jgi:CcmD family protein
VDGSLIFLFAAVVVIWVAVFIYLLNISGRLAALRRELDALERPDLDPRGEDPSKKPEESP